MTSLSQTSVGLQTKPGRLRGLLGHVQRALQGADDCFFRRFDLRMNMLTSFKDAKRSNHPLPI